MRGVKTKAKRKTAPEEMVERVFSALSDKEKKRVPCVVSSAFDRGNKAVSFFLLAHDQPGIGTFLTEIVSHTFPKRLLFFFMKKIDDQYLISELCVHFKSDLEFLRLKKKITLVEQKLSMGLRSPYHMRQILEMKHRNIEEKRGDIQKRVDHIVHRFPSFFDFDFFPFIEHYFSRVNSEYFRFHLIGQMSSNLCAFYLLRKTMINACEKRSHKRHLWIKIWKRHLDLPLGKEEVLGLLIGLNFLKEYEMFSEKHLMKAIDSVLPKVSFLEESLYHYRDVKHRFSLFYLEIDSNQKERLKRELPFAFKERIEHLQHSLFMPRNEEEVMRHIVTLGKELRFSKDLPQVIFSFDHQGESHIYFTVILTHILLPGGVKGKELIAKLTELHPEIEKIKKIGLLRRKYVKEALVFKVAFPFYDFLRKDQSIDLYLARLFILKQLEKVWGPVRDYNGGMLLKQNEVFVCLHRLLKEKALKYSLLLDQFFHSLKPVEKRSVSDPKALKILFELLVQVIEQRKKHLRYSKNQTEYLVFKKGNFPKLEALFCSYDQISASSSPLFFKLVYEGKLFLGCIKEKINLLCGLAPISHGPYSKSCK